MWNQQFECLPRRELEALQLQRLKKTVELVSRQVPFYQERLTEAGVSAESLESLKDVERLPFTAKSNLRDYYPFGFCAVDVSDIRRIHASSGTRGKPTIAAYTKGDLATWSDISARCLATAGARPGDVLHNSYGYGLFTGGLGIHQGAETLGATVIPASGGRTQQQVMLLKDFRARILCCTPSYALNLALCLDDMKLSPGDLKLEIGIFGAEPWSQECRRQLEERLNIQALDIYGLSEVMGPGVAVECLTTKSGLHIWEDHFLPEIIHPETLAPLPDGEEGELVLTTLTKEGLPLLRYRTGDICSLIAEPCACGRTARRMSRVRGRLDDMLIIRGVNVYPSEIETVLFSAAALAPQYQIVIHRERALDVLTVRAEFAQSTAQTWHRHGSDEHDERRKLTDTITTRLKNQLGLTALVELLPSGTIALSEGKAVRVLDLRLQQDS